VAVLASWQEDIVTADLAEITGIDTPTGLLIGGQWSAGRAGTLAVINPATEEAITEVADASPEDGLAAVDAAERGECLRRAFELMTQRSEQLARLMVLENGKALRDARGEILYAAEFFRWYSEEAVRLDGHLSVAPSGANRIMVQRQPVGVSFMITPWNFPAAMATRKIGPALAAGCNVVL
jgi:succinate-semialdehyde dehydrogenase/glutarate-semialdehyde dehydrogenase